MKSKMRAYRDEEDFWRIRQLLREAVLLNGLREWSWSVLRLDYWRWHGIENCGWCTALEEVTFLWETSQGQLVAALHPEDAGEGFLQVHPEYKTGQLEEEMILAEAPIKGLWRKRR